MTIQKGRDFLLKIGDGATPTGGFTTIGASRTNAMSINNNPVDVTTKTEEFVQKQIDRNNAVWMEFCD